MVNQNQPCPLITVCEVCHRQRIGDDETGTWVDAPAGGYPKTACTSHGCCPICNEARYIAAGFEPPLGRAHATKNRFVEVKCERHNGRWLLTIRYADDRIVKKEFKFIINALEEAMAACKDAGEY